MNYRAWVAALAPVAIMGTLLACKRSGTTGADASVGPSVASDTAQLNIDLSKVFDDYAANEVRADGEYKGRTIATAGVVRDIRKDAFGSMHIRLEDGNQRIRPHAECIPDKSEEAIVASLSKGQAAAFRGTVRGLVLGSVLFGDCEIRTQETGR